MRARTNVEQASCLSSRFVHVGRDGPRGWKPVARDTATVTQAGLFEEAQCQRLRKTLLRMCNMPLATAAG